ncbi:MAG: hypothetical protein ACYS8I_08340 [Planctomycetota bacterium]|jgi:hypothetical protein
MRHTLDREIAVINTIMLADKNAEPFLRLLTEEHFICPEVREFFIGINAMYQRSGVVPDRQAVLLGPQFQEMVALPLFEVAPTHPDDPKQSFKNSRQIKNAIHEMEADLAIKGVEEEINPLYDRLSQDLCTMSADEKLKLVDEFKKRFEKLPTDGSSGLSKPEKIRSLLARAFGSRLSYEGVREKLEISSKELNKIAAREERRDQPRFRRERTPNGKFTSFLVLTRGLHMVRMMEKGNVSDYREDVAYLPDALEKYITHYGAFGQHAFIGIAAWTDGLKTRLMLEFARASARKGRKVLLINYELDDRGIHIALASLEAGYRVQDIEEANRIVRETRWIQNITVMNIRQAVSLEELCAHIKTQECDLVVWDYLATHFLHVDVSRQASAPATIVQTIGVELVDAGIPVFMAIQSGMEEGFAFPITWLHRCTLALVLIDFCVKNVIVSIQGGTHDATAWFRRGLGSSATSRLEALG